MPQIAGKELTISEIKNTLSIGNINLSPMGGGSYDFVRGQDGCGTFRLERTARRETGKVEAAAITYVFESGELWSIDSSILTTTPIIISTLESEFSITTNRRHEGVYFYSSGISDLDFMTFQ